MPKHILVGKIYSDKCVFCTQLKPTWEKLKKNLTTKFPNIEFKEIDDKQFDTGNYKTKFYKDNTDLTSKLTLNGGYPTIFKIVDKGEPEYYENDRSVDALTKWAVVKTKTNGGKSRKSKKKQNLRKNKSSKKLKKTKTSNKSNKKTVMRRMKLLFNFGK
jgi:hypothetical protein